jgi:pimeloyl-ACP methyl ester carboxylesterase
VLSLGVQACAWNADTATLVRLRPCPAEQGLTDASCGTLTVFENRDTREGRRIDLSLVVLPALGRDVQPDPLFFLAGGPGQGAARMARQVREGFRQVLRARDIVLVDQRGTGKSNPLHCRSQSNTLSDLLESDDASLARLRACLEGYDADVRLYVTPIAMDDLDDVRAYLGYERINLYGGSYGTRAALVYLRQHGHRVRSAILDGVAPPDMRLPLYSARDAGRALDKLLEDCESDPPCRAAHPGLASRVRALVARLERNPPRVRAVHPRTGIAEDIRIEARVVAGMIFAALYSPLTSSLLPGLIERAERDDFQGLLALAFAGEGAADEMSIGMQLSVLCSEDAVRVTAADLARETTGHVFGPHLLRGQVRACEIWPKGSLPENYYEPVVSDVPALVLSGDADPVTPPTWGEDVARHLKNAVHLSLPGTGHGVVSTPCGARLVAEFLDRGRADGLDTSCAASTRRPPFVLTPAGPDPSPPRGAPAP